MAGIGNIGTVYVNVAPSSSGFAKSLGAAGSAGGITAGNMFKSSFGSIVGGSAIGNVLAAGFSKAMGAISSSMGAAVSRVDTLNNFPKVMVNLGYGATEATASINALSAGIDGLPTSLDGIVSMTQQLAPLCGGMEKATSLSLAMNNMFLASGASTADQARAMQQYTQMLGRGKVELNDWRTLQEVMPGQLNQVASAMLGVGKNSTDLYDALKSGNVTMDDFNAAVLRLNQEGVNGFASFEEQARTSTEGIGTAMENVQNRVAKAVGKVIDHIGQSNISGAINGFSSQFGAVADKFIAMWDGMMSTIDFEGFKTVFGELQSAVGGLFSQGDTAATFGAQLGTAINGLIPVIHVLTPFVQMFALALKIAMDNASWLIPVLLVAVAAFKGFGIVNTAAGFLQVFTGKVKLAKTPTAQCAKEMLGVGAAALMVGAGVALACAGVWLLSNAAISLASEGGMAIVVMFGMVAAVAALAVVFGLLAPSLSSSAVGLIALGASVLLVAAGLAILATCAIALSEAGSPAILMMFGMVAVVAALAVVFAALGPVLTAGAVGMLAFGMAAMMVGVALVLVATSILIVSTSLPLLSQYGMSGAAALVSLAGAVALCGAGLLVMGAGALVAAVGVLALGAAILVAAVGTAMLAAAVLVLSAGVLVLGAGLMLCGTAMLLVATGATMGAAALAMMAPAALAAAPGLAALGVSAGAAALGLMAAVPGLTGLAGAAMMGAAGILGIAAGFTSATATCSSYSAAMAKAQKTTDSSCNSMSQNMEKLKNKASSTVSQIVQQFSGMRLYIPSPQLGPMPHFYINGSFNMETGSVPTIGVNWYARGAVFKKASIVGVAEAGDEMALPLDNKSATAPLANQIADCVVGRQSETADKIASLLVQVVYLLEEISGRIPKATSARDMRRMQAYART